MAKIKYIQFNGAERVVDVAAGASLMSGAVDNGIPGILADCGGAATCGTCHVYIDPAWSDKLPAPIPMEANMLECIDNVVANSRLSCQIQITDALDGMTVRLPEKQF